MKSKPLVTALATFGALVLVGGAGLAGYFAYVDWAFPEERCEAAKHLDAPAAMQKADPNSPDFIDMGDCYACHVKATPKIAQEWYESKHGVVLVRCQTCHGLPDGTGSQPFARIPSVDVCIRCHSLAVDKMEAKFGKREDCSTCHPNHQSPMHGNAYEFRQATTQTTIQSAD